MVFLCTVFFGPDADASLPPSSAATVDWLTGAKVASSSKEVTAIVFVSPICPCSKFHEKALKELAGQFPGVQFVAVYSGNDAMSEDEARAHFRKTGWGFPILRDSGFELANKLGALRTPHAFVLNRTGEVLYKGAVDDTRTNEPSQRFLQSALVAIQQGKKPETTSTRPMGCRIGR